MVHSGLSRLARDPSLYVTGNYHLPVILREQDGTKLCILPESRLQLENQQHYKQQQHLGHELLRLLTENI